MDAALLENGSSSGGRYSLSQRQRLRGASSMAEPLFTSALALGFQPCDAITGQSGPFGRPDGFMSRAWIVTALNGSGLGRTFAPTCLQIRKKYSKNVCWTSPLCRKQTWAKAE
jgi:hypothetical protein